MDMNNGGPAPQQPNGILPRPQSQSQRPPPPPPTPPQQMFPVDELDDLEDDDGEFGEKPAPIVVVAPAKSGKHSSRSREHSREVIKSKSKEEEVSPRPVNMPKFLKIAVVGDSTVGKSCLCQAITSESYVFKKQYQLTWGVAVYAKSVKLPESGDSGERVTMALLDSSGKNMYLEFLPEYWERLDGYAVVIDLTTPSSLTNAGKWLQLAKDNCNSEEPRPVLGVLIGTKSDLVEQRAITAQEAQGFAKKNELRYFECSVKGNTGLEEPFFYLAHKWNATGGDIGDIEDKENKP